MEYSVDVPRNLENEYLRVWNQLQSMPQNNVFAALQRLEMENRAAQLDKQLARYPGTDRIMAARNLQGGDSADDPVNMVLVTDGADSCGGDPCRVARALKRQKPGLIINVIDMSQTDRLSCVAQVTGGRYRQSRGNDVEALTRAIANASGYEGDGQCRPAGASD